MNVQRRLYVFDTSSFRILRHYFPERFLTFWQSFQELVDQGIIISVREVDIELKEQIHEDWLLEWFRSKRSIFKTPTADESGFVSEIFKVSHFQQLVSEKHRLAGKPVADPWVIAHAQVHRGHVVTEEQFKPNAAKIPNVCKHFNVPCLNLEGFLQEQGWVF